MSKSLGNVIDPLDIRDGVTLKVLLDKLKASNLDEKEIQRASDETKKEYPNGIEECGADALRFGLLSYSTLSSKCDAPLLCSALPRLVPTRLVCFSVLCCVVFDSPTAQNINLDIARIITYRQFGNKLWNATKFALRNFPTNYAPPANM